MGQSPKGDSGQAIEQVMNDKVITVGTHANIHPSIRIDPTNKEITKYRVSKKGGMKKSISALPKYTSIDNSGDFHGGTFTITALNSFNVEAAAGGIHLESNGCIEISSWGGIINLTGTYGVGIQGEMINITSARATTLSGKMLIFDTDEMMFNKNVSFNNNVSINGGLAVNGELIARHITAMRSLQVTSAAGVDGLPRSGGRFSTSSRALQITQDDTATAPSFIIGSLSTGIAISGAAAMPIEAIYDPDSQKLIISNQPILISTPTWANVFLDTMSHIIEPGLLDTAITQSLPHFHYFDGPAISYVDGLSDLSKEMSDCEGNSPKSAKLNLPSDLSKEGLQNKLMGYIKDAALDMAGAII